MAKRKSKIAESLKHLGDIQVAEWDFAGLMNTDVKDLEIARSLRRIGRIRVMEWDFRTVLPAVRKTANIEVDVIDCFKRAASYKVMEWDFRTPLGTSHPSHHPANVAAPGLSSAKMQELITRLKNFVEYVATNLIEEPAHAQIKVSVIAPEVLRLRLVLVNKDVARFIGISGHTASAIRKILKQVGAMHGVYVLLEILSHEQAAAARLEQG